jgi:ribonucleotide reductase alpha subunit
MIATSDNKMKTFVTKRNGTKEEVSFDKVLRRIQGLCSGLERVNPYTVAQKVLGGLIDGITTSKLDELASDVAANMILEHPEYGVLAARVAVSNLQKETPASFSECINELWDNNDKHGNPAPIVSEALLAIVNANKEAINARIKNERDYAFDYFGFKTLERSYLQQKNGRVVERPQYMYMRVALGIHGPRLEDAFETYDLLSQGYFTHATPTLFNAGTRHAQLASCYLASSKADSVEGMYDTVKECALISKYAGGIGVHLHDIRASGSYIRGTNGYSAGLPPLLKVFDQAAVHINQSGKRNGSIAVYLEPWHADVEAFLDMKRPHGKEETRARNLFYALWVPDLFMERVNSDKPWTLMCPDECPGLADAWGPAFKELYEKYEAEGRGRKTVPARKIWFSILDCQVETGVPYLLAKDACNGKSNQQNLGTIKSSNLCVAPETLILTDKGHEEIKSLAGQTVVKVWNGEVFSEVKVVQTGADQKLIKVTVKVVDHSRDSCEHSSCGWGKCSRFEPASPRQVDIHCTPYHKFILKGDCIKTSERVEAAKLTSGMTLFPYHGIYEYTVLSVKDEGRVDDTYCFNEPLNNAGVFNGILAGNCAEVIEYSSPEETAVCNLASIALPKYVMGGGAPHDPPTFCYAKLREVVKVATANLNKIIDITFYPVEPARRSNTRHRPIGIGVQGLADVFALMKIPFDSPEAAKVNREIFENMYYAAVERSCELAEKEGTYETFKGSPASDGKLQYHLWGDAPRESVSYLDWPTLEARVKAVGLRNSLLIALMPTASTAQILNNTESFEPFPSNIFTRRVLAGEFICINKHLVRDLEELGLWTPAMQARLISSKGSVADMADMPKDIRDRYKTVWEIKQRVVIDMARDRAPFVCQSQSMNLHFADPSAQVLSNSHMYAWGKGLKTISYYVRSKPKAQVEGFKVGNHGSLPSGGAAGGGSVETPVCDVCSA